MHVYKTNTLPFHLAFLSTNLLQPLQENESHLLQEVVIHLRVKEHN